MNYKPIILSIEDDKTIRNFIRISLESQGYKCIETDTAKNGLLMAYSHKPDVILLDLGLPDMDGLEVIRNLRETMKTPIIVVSARGHDQDKIEALDLGADDYLTKPFSVPELLARIRVALRHKKSFQETLENQPLKFELDGLVIDYDKHRVTVGGEEIHLTPIEFKLIELLSYHAGKVLTHRFIINEIWGGYGESDTQSLRVFMASVRRKIEKDSAQPRYLITEVGVGYRLVDE